MYSLYDAEILEINIDLTKYNTFYTSPPETIWICCPASVIWTKPEQ